MGDADAIGDRQTQACASLAAVWAGLAVGPSGWNGLITVGAGQPIPEAMHRFDRVGCAATAQFASQDVAVGLHRVYASGCIQGPDPIQQLAAVKILNRMA